MNLIKILPLLFVAGALVSCATAQHSLTGSTAPGGGDPVSEWAKTTQGDRMAANRGMASPRLVAIDIEIGKAIPQVQAAIASNDKAQARVVSDKMNALIAQRAAVIHEYLLQSQAQLKAVKAATAGAHGDPCIDIAGRNICGASGSPSQPSSGTFVCGSGPGPGQRQVGVAGGGNGVAPTPICSWN